MSGDKLFLGFDLSTQLLKIIATYEDLKHFKTYRVEFDQEFREKYDIENGVRTVEETGEIYSPVEMWIEAIDLIFGRMKEDSFPFQKVYGISGSCQQHGSVYWTEELLSSLKNLKSSDSLLKQLPLSCFATNRSPNWQDHSTGDELKDFESTVKNGPPGLSAITGSRAHYRFTGPQIRKKLKKESEVYKKSARISLVSSFVSSLLCGEITNIEESDACGMNVYDIANSRWDDELLALLAAKHPSIDKCSEDEMKTAIEDLKKKLGPVDKVGYKPISAIAQYYQDRYGFNKECQIYTFTGDNLATILSLPLRNNDVLISMGTSTTVLLVTDKYITSPNYHLFKHPTIEGSYMGMICYCNGSLPRVKINKKLGGSEKDWTKFGEVLSNSKPLNGDNKLGVYFDIGEIVPNCLAQTRRFQYKDSKLEELDSWPIEEDVSSIVESQALSCRLRAGPLLASVSKDEDVFSEGEQKTLDKFTKFGEISSDGVKQTPKSLLSHPNKIFYVGGASKNLQIIQKFAAILGPLSGNYKVELNDACALGGCYKSIWSHERFTGSIEEGYDEWLDSNFRWEDNVEQFEAHDQWEEYVDGIGILSLIEKQLYS